jgi:outer membrane immunogenic protein
MRNRWLMGAAAAALTVAGAVSAQAADLPTRKEAPAPVYVPPPFTWTGFYVGVNAGGVWSSGSHDVNFYSPTLGFLSGSFPGGLGSSPGGWLLGGQAGYNYQSGAAVFGIETDFDWTDLTRNRNVIGPTFTGVGVPAAFVGDYFSSHFHSSLDWLGTTRLRVGFVATPDNRLMLYGTGGIAYGGGSTNFSFWDATKGALWSGNPSSSRVGWTLGAGAEYAFTNNITFKGEYLYADLGSHSFTSVGNPVAATFFPGVYASGKVAFNASIFRVGVNYKF